MLFDFVEKQLQAANAEYRRELVARRHQCGRAVREKRLQILNRPRVVTDMGMAVDKPWCNVASTCVDHFRLGAAGVFGAQTDIADAAVEHGDFKTFEQFAGIDVDELAAANDQVSANLAERAAHQSFEFWFCTSHRAVCNMKAETLPKVHDDET